MPSVTTRMPVAILSLNKSVASSTPATAAARVGPITMTIGEIIIPLRPASMALASASMALASAMSIEGVVSLQKGTSSGRGMASRSGLPCPEEKEVADRHQQDVPERKPLLQFDRLTGTHLGAQADTVGPGAGHRHLGFPSGFLASVRIGACWGGDRVCLPEGESDALHRKGDVRDRLTKGWRGRDGGRLHEPKLRLDVARRIALRKRVIGILVPGGAMALRPER